MKNESQSMHEIEDVIDSICEFYIDRRFRRSRTTFTEEIWLLVKTFLKPIWTCVITLGQADNGFQELRGNPCGMWASKNQRRAIDSFARLAGNKLLSLNVKERAGTTEVHRRSFRFLLMSFRGCYLHVRRQIGIVGSSSELARLIRISLQASLLYYGWRSLLFSHRPAFLLLANDHLLRFRSIAHAAKDAKIPVGYVQHASVTSLFPSLRCFDVAFLDGMYSEEVYSSKDGWDKVKVVRAGAIRNFNLHESRGKRSWQINDVGVAINTQTTIPRLMSLVEILKDGGFVDRIVIRVHPRQDVSDFVKLQGHGVYLDNSDTVEEFIGKIDVLICGSTSTAMEGITAGIPCLYYQLEEDAFRDAYGFTDSGLLPEITDCKDVYNIKVFARQLAEEQRIKFGYFDEGCQQSIESLTRHIISCFQDYTNQSKERCT